METGFLPVPDWFSFENQGAGVAVASLGNDGRQDLIVLMVDNPPGQNRGIYRIGRNLDANGNINGGWTPWFDIPDWFSAENQGAGIAAADLDNDGSLELVVLMVDSPAGPNRGVFRIGRRLDANGIVTGGWTPWVDVPDWFSFENQGASVALSPPDAQGRRSLIVFMIDNPPQQNRGVYRIGRNLDANGTVTGGWSPWIDVPDWFSWENEGAGVAVVDLENSGQQDVIVFQIDASPGQNQGFFRIGRRIGADGNVGGGWSPWHGVPSWFSFENQGGGIATAPLTGNRSHEMVVLMVDNTAGQNAGLFQVMGLDNDPTTQGNWEVLPYDSEVLAVHAALLPGGRVLFAAGSGNSAVRFNDPAFGDVSRRFWCSVVWDYAASTPAQPTYFYPNTLRNGQGDVLDFFCGGEAFLADGRLLTAGGTLEYDVDADNNPIGGFHGRAATQAFDRTTRQWTRMADMADGRWYPTLVTLGDGRVLIAAGYGRNGEANRSLEVFTPNASVGFWTQLPLPSFDVFSQLPLYAHLFLMANGLIFFTGGRMDDGGISLPPCLLDITTNPIQVRPIAGLAEVNSRNQSASVLLPPAQDQRVMIMGGATAAGEDNATDSVDIVNLRTLDPLPTYQAASRMRLPRLHVNAVLLPDRTVFVSGGALQREGGEAPRTTARLQSEIYDPLNNTWRLGATAQVGRMYHSVALLLPDGRVIAAGGNPEKGRQVAWEPADPNEELRLELYSPPYLFQGARPEIGAVATEWQYGQTVTIPSPQAGSIRWANLIKNCVTTHSFDSGQRLVDLEILAQGGGQLTGRVTSDRNIAPPGWYMLFLTDNARVPSVATWVHLT